MKLLSEFVAETHGHTLWVCCQDCQPVHQMVLGEHIWVMTGWGEPKRAGIGVSLEQLAYAIHTYAITQIWVVEHLNCHLSGPAVVHPSLKRRQRMPMRVDAMAFAFASGMEPVESDPLLEKQLLAVSKRVAFSRHELHMSGLCSGRAVQVGGLVIDDRDLAADDPAVYVCREETIQLIGNGYFEN